MNHAPHATLDPRQLIDVLAANLRRWLVPAALVSSLVFAYALLRPDTWEASQALIVRNEATATAAERPGKFTQPDEMKTVQETILELARSRGVLFAALKEVGPPSRCGHPKDWPTERDVAELRQHAKLLPPKGAEFGKTEVFYLKVRDRDRARAVALAEGITKHLQSSFQQLRDSKAQSMIHELVKAVYLSAEDLRESTDRLAEIETEVGSDLSELRILHDATTGDSALRRTMTEIRNELRQAQADRATYEEMLTLLREAQKDPNRLLGMPGRLLESQHALRRLKEGLVDAGIQAASLQGRMSIDHPLVRAAQEAQRKIHEDVYRELAVAIRGIEAELRLNADRVTLLEEQLDQVTGKLAKLAALRTTYSHHVADTQNRKMLLERAQEKLAEARTTQATANTASLIARIDRPDTGTDPVGVSRAVLALAGIIAGLISGLGVLLLTLPQAPPPVKAAWTPVALPIRSEESRPAPLVEPLTLKHALFRLNAVPCEVRR